jgi:molybdopterin/thiamine biosynthesis adenylyltransferase
MESNRFWRQLDLCPPDKLTFPITVIGAGAIGSATVVTLAKMGCSDITVWDEDVLADHNVPNQMCLLDRVGQPKVDALAELVEMLTGVKIKPVSSNYRGQRLEGVVISAVDSMTARQLIWKSVKLKKSVTLFIDARMGAEILRLYTLRPTDLDACEFFEGNLYGSDEAEQLPCSARSIIYCPAVAGALIAAQVKAFAVGEPVQREVLFDIPRMRLIAA